MGTNHMGRQSIRFPQPPVVRGFASVAGKKEREGPLGDQFTATVQDTTFGEKSWEQAERRMQQMTLELALEKAGLTDADLDAAFAGDLLNQCIGSSFSLRNRGVPTLGLYGACSTMAESLLLAAMSVSGGFARTALAILSLYRPDDLRRIVLEEDVDALTRVSGIGKKTAQHVFLELKYKLKVEDVPQAAVLAPNGRPGSVFRDVLDGLSNLGYSEDECAPVVKNILLQEPDLDVTGALRAALKALARGRL